MRILALMALLFAVIGAGATQSISRTAAQLQPNHRSISLGDNESTFLILTDIHFDPLTGTDPRLIEQLASAPVEKWPSIFDSSPDQELAPDGADANYALLSSALNAARNSEARYDYILVTGDFLAHNFREKYRAYAHPDGEGYEDFVIKTMTFVVRAIRQTFPATPIYAAFGNNDSVIDDYAPQGPRLLAAMGREWGIAAVGPKARKDFLSAGYYAAPHPTIPGFEFIVLNTAYWSNKLRAASDPDQASAELNWLTAQLDRLRQSHKSAAILMHIPPGVDAYDSAKPGRCASPTLFWKKQYMDSFLATVAAHQSVVRDGFAGHTHIDDFRVLTDSSGRPFFQIHIAPSIGRDHHNNPGYEIGVYDKTNGAMVDYAAIYLRRAPAEAFGKPAWTLSYDFREQSHSENYGPATLETIALLIRSSQAIRTRVMDLFGTRSSSTPPVPVKDWRFYSCAQTETDADSFSRCACPSTAGNN
jgi:sphingomyelin phosphodiesterase acid-like 3